MRELRRLGPLVGLALVLSLPAAVAQAAPDALRTQQWALDAIHADEAHRVSTGAGVTVAVIDTGVDAAHPDLAGAVVPGPDLVDGDGDPSDSSGHGTHVAGIVGARADNGIGIEGVAPDARILAIRVLDANGTGAAATVAAGVDAAVRAGAQVINLSVASRANALSLVIPVTELDAALQRAVDAGAVVVAAAGNDALPICEQPSIRGRILCVGAVDRRLSKASYSDFGLGLGIVAPGGSATGEPDEDVLSTWNDGGYASLAGTSQATPHVAGVAALLVALGLRGDAVVQRIASSARDLGLPGNDPVYASGLVDAGAAVDGLGPVPPRTAPPPPHPGASASKALVTAPSRVRARTLERGRVRVRCRAVTTGTCSARLVVGGVTVARGRARVRAGRTVVVRLRPTVAGRRLVHRRRSRSVRATLVVRVPGAPGVRRPMGVAC